MRDGGRIAAALDVLADFEARRVPLKVCLADWARGARYAGSKDRAFISGLCLDVLRRHRSLQGLGHGNRGAIVRILTDSWGWDVDRVIAAFGDKPHGPGELDRETAQHLAAGRISAELSLADQADVPDFVVPLLQRLGGDPVAIGQGATRRAPFDLRVNTLRSTPEDVLRVLKDYEISASPLARAGLRIETLAAAKAPNLTITPAFQQGWLEVQDEGSQIAALAAGDVGGATVLDFCAGGGGKTLALAAMMAGNGRIFSYDCDAARLAPIFERLQRSGVQNAEVISPAQNAEDLSKLTGAMDLVFVDAPCSGAGTWRRRPDTKWRLTEQQLASRLADQDQVLDQAAAYVRPGGVLVFVTCSPFADENEDRIAAFLERQDGAFVAEPVGPALIASEGVTTLGETQLCADPAALTLKLLPHAHGTDGFGISRVRRA